MNYSDIPYQIRITAQSRQSARTSSKASRTGKSVLQLDESGNLIAEYSSMRKASKATKGCNEQLISNCCRGVQKTHNGYIWRYKDIDI